MANYSINLTDNGNGSYAISAGVLRAPSTSASGGTDLTASSQFSSVASSNTWLALGDAVQRAMEMLLDDKAKNG